jgi:flagellar biosynthesis GTPase FlhF
MDDKALILIEPAQRSLLLETSAWMAEVSAVKVTTPEESANAQVVVKLLIERKKQITEDKKMAEAPYLTPLSLVRDTYNAILDGLENLRVKVKGANDTYIQEEERKARAEQRRLEIEAEAKRRAAEEEARKQREQAEAARRAEEEAMRRAQQAQNEQARQKALAEAEAKRQEAQAAAEQATATEEIAATTVAPLVQSAAPPITGRGASSRDNWTKLTKIHDPVLFRAHCIKTLVETAYATFQKGGDSQAALMDVNRIPETLFLDADEKRLKKYADTTKTPAQFPGAEIVKTRV